jgi:hypothetical protein
MILVALLLGQAAPQCAAMDVNLPAPLAAWATPGHGDPTDIGKTVTLKTLAMDQVPNLPASAKPGGATAVGFSIDKAGAWGIALDQPGWIDVVPHAPGAQPLKSVKHGHGPECSTIRKIVRFDLQPGRYRLVLTGLTKPMAKTLLVAPD